MAQEKQLRCGVVRIMEFTKSELVDRLLLHVRTDNYKGFCSAVDSGFQRFGEKELYNIMTSDLLKQIYDCGEIDTFLAWGDKLYNDGFDNWKDRIEKDV